MIVKVVIDIRVYDIWIPYTKLIILYDHHFHLSFIIKTLGGIKVEI